MDRMFSMDDLSDGFWSPHAPPIDLHDDADVEQTSTAAAGAGMNRSSSEWAFQRFLQESDDIVKIKPNPHRDNHDQPPPPPPPPSSIPIDPVEYQALLKSRLELACAAVALTRASNGKAVQSAASATDIGSQVSNSSSTTANERESSKTQVKDLGGTVGEPPLLAISRKSVTQVRSTTSGSSGDQSDDDEAEGETEDTQNMDPADTKRMRRMLSNRESARRSRRRKQAHLTERETQVSQLKVENSSLLKRLTDINQKYNESAVDNRVLKADVETLRAKVKMAEENVKRVTGLNSLFHAMSEIPIPTASVPTFAHSLETSAESSVPIQDDPTQHYYHSMPNNHLTNHRIQTDLVEIPRPENVQPNTTTATGGNKMGGTVSMQRVGSLEHPQKHGTSSSAARGAGKR